MPTTIAEKPSAEVPAGAALETLKITDSRTGKSYEIPIEHGTVKAIDLRQIKTGPEDFGPRRVTKARKSRDTKVR